MRYNDIIGEDADKDLFDDKEVNDAVLAVVDHVYSGKPFSMLNGRFPYLYLRQLGVKGRLANVYVVPVPSYEHGGSAQPMDGALDTQHGGEPHYIVQVPVEGYSPEDLKRLNSTTTMEVLSHEFHHVLDHQRLTPKGRASYGTAQAYSDPDGEDSYVNSPTEFNSYFYGLASKLTQRIRDLEEHRDLEVLDHYAELPRDFKTALPIIIGEASPTDRTVYDRFNPTMKRHLVKRLFGVFKKFWQTHDSVTPAK